MATVMFVIIACVQSVYGLLQLVEGMQKASQDFADRSCQPDKDVTYGSLQSFLHNRPHTFVYRQLLENRRSGRHANALDVATALVRGQPM